MWEGGEAQKWYLQRKSVFDRYLSLGGPNAEPQEVALDVYI